jgi:hypothetical protein
MQYLLLIYGDESNWARLTPEQISQEMAAYFAYTDALKKSGKLRGGDELHPVATAKSVTVRNGKQGVVDGPYVDTKEALGGYYLVEVENEAEAIEWAAKCPGAKYGGIEVRPVVMR